jgi:tRNA (guanine37-N1)-methyltransferase
MKIDIMTLFPEYFFSPLSMSILKRAEEKKIVSYNFHNIRDFGLGKRKQVDDSPYGGGPGLVMKPDVLMNCFKSIPKYKNSKVIYLSPRGKTFNQKMAQEFSNYSQLILIAGHYEGVDQRFLELSNAIEISLGDFVLTGGEPAILSLIDAVVRLIPGVLGNATSVKNESFSMPLLEHDQYTMPRVYETLKVPKVLLEGNHAKIEKWRLKNSLKITLQNRPDLLSLLPIDFFEDFDL